MLFDLRGRGRRSLVRVVYIGLAVLIGGGLVLFGVGGGFGGTGILSANSENGGSGGGTSYKSQVAKYRKQTAKKPADAAAWEGLTSALLHQAGQETGESTTISRGVHELYEQAGESWSRYVALHPAKPNSELAQRMLIVYSSEGLNKPAQAVEVLQAIVESRPTATYYTELARYAYKAKETRVGDLAAEKAVALAPAEEKARFKTYLAEIKANPEELQTATVKGKKVVGHLGKNGTFTGTESKKTPQPATSSKTSTTSTSKK